jgi:hypothetical protein
MVVGLFSVLVLILFFLVFPFQQILVHSEKGRVNMWACEDELRGTIDGPRLQQEMNKKTKETKGSK